MNKLEAPEKILIVDDAIENIRFLRHTLKDEREHILFALDGDKALEIARTQLPDLILLDAVMPGKDGYAVCAELKQSDQTRDIPVIFVTVLNSPEDEARALEAGAVDFITKPINPAVVRARVRTHLTLKRQSDLLRQTSLTDGLTGVANRRCLDEMLGKEWRRCERVGQPIAFILADLDYFKRFNDHYGHQAGDTCLVSVAAVLSGCVRRPPDFIARYGGEEFAVVLPHANIESATVVAGNMLERVRALAIPHDGSACAPYVTVSLGVAAMKPCRTLTAATLIAAADARLYRAKAEGRNRYCVERGEPGA